MTSTVVYTGDLRTYCTHLQSSSSFETDAPVDNNGKGERFSPTDLMATSLASCMLTVMGIKARSMGFDLTDIKAEVKKLMKTDPRRVGGIHLTFHIPDNLAQINEKDKAIFKKYRYYLPGTKKFTPGYRGANSLGALELSTIAKLFYFNQLYLKRTFSP